MGRNIGGAYNTANEWSVPPMPATVSVPDSLSSLLRRFRSCFTAPGYEVFTAMFTGFILRPVERTVCGMLTGAGLAGIWHHSRPPILLRNPLGRAAGRPDPGHPGHGNTARTQRGDHARYRRNTHPPAGTEGVRCVLVARRLRRRRRENLLRE